MNQVYLITFVTADRTPHFTNFTLARIIIAALMRTKGAETLSFVVMPDHVHWLVSLNQEKKLAEIVRNVKSVGARNVNRVLGRKGRIWQDGYHDHALRKEEDVKTIARYIIANPIRAGLVKTVRHYPHWDAKWI